MSDIVSISKVTREILGNEADLLNDLEKGGKKQREIAREILPLIKEKTGLHDISEASVAVAISRFVRELRGSREGQKKNYIERAYFQEYLVSAPIITKDKLSKISIPYLSLENFSRFMTDFYAIHQASFPLIVCYSHGIEIYVNEVDRENMLRELPKFLNPSVKPESLPQKRDLALVTVQLHKFAESAPSIPSFLTSFIAENEKIRLQDMFVHHSNMVEYSVIVASDAMADVVNLLDDLRKTR